MDISTSKLVLAAAGGSAESPPYVDDLFSTFLYEGTGSAQTINNGIDLAGKGGLVWFKQRDTTYSHALIDTERGGSKWIRSNSDEPEVTNSAAITSFNSNGFSLGSYDQINNNNEDHVAWSFRKALGFFDVVTYSGTGSVQNIAHSLGSTPGMIMVRCRVGTHDWEVYHRSTGPTTSLHINTTDAVNYDSTVWNDTSPTSTQFTVGTNNNVNQNGHTYIAYIFAHDDPQFGTGGNESIIKCGSYTGTAATNNTINLGFEPQWVMVKSITPGNPQPWFMLDNMRGAPSGGNDAYMYANATQEERDFEIITFNSTGFSLEATGGGVNGSGQNYIYMAIRRPNKPPESATDVFAIDVNTTGDPEYVSNFVVDMGLFTAPTYTANRFTLSRLTGRGTVRTQDEASKSDFGTLQQFDFMNGFGRATSDDANYRGYMWKRAPGFFDVVAYKGSGSTTTQAHNLEVAPEIFIIKNLTDYQPWIVYTTAIDGSLDYSILNSQNSFADSSNSVPTSSHLNLVSAPTINASGDYYVGHLFASLSGIQKVGTYTGTGYAINVDCGFTNGARFVLIKRTDDTGDWYVYDTFGGIVSGNDPYFVLNFTTVGTTNTDYIDPLSSGFTITSSAPAALNASGGTYLFLAIA